MNKKTIEIFEDELREEFDNQENEKLFFSYLLQYFEKYPFENNDDDDDLVMREYSENELFGEFCRCVGLQASDAIKRQFLVSIRRIIFKINFSTINEKTTNSDIHIYSVRRFLHITLKAVSEYYEKNKAEIESIKTMFSLQGKNSEKKLALLYLFASGENDEVIQKFRNKTGLCDDRYNPTSGDITQYNVMLVTALMFNPSFYAMADNYYGAIRAGFPIWKPEEDKEDSVPVAATVAKTPVSKLESFQNGMKIEIKSEEYQVVVTFFLLTKESKSRGLNTANDATGDFEKIKSDCTKKIEANPNDYDAYIMRGLAQFKLGEWSDALKDFEEVVEKVDRQGMEGVYYAMGYIYRQKGKVFKPKAIKAFEKVKEINPDFADIDEILEHGSGYLDV